MARTSRRKLLYGLSGFTGLIAAACAVRVWNLHQHLPPRDPAAEDRYLQAQRRILAENGDHVHSRFVQIAEPRLRVQVLEGGAGEPVLLIHGGDGTASQWEPLLSQLSTSFHVYAPDRPGCGLTRMFDYTGVPFREHAVAFVGSVMDALHLKRATLIGNSMGGYFSLVYALAHPERVTRLVTIGEPAGSAAVMPAGMRPISIRGVNGLLYATVMRPGPNATYEGFRRILVAHPERIPQSYLDANTAAAQIPGATESWLTMVENVTHGRQSTLTYALRPELKNLPMPVLMIWGEQDTFGPPSLATEMAGMMPQGKTVIVRDAGHLVWLDQPDQVERSVRTFLQG